MNQLLCGHQDRIIVAVLPRDQPLDKSEQLLTALFARRETLPIEASRPGQRQAVNLRQQLRRHAWLIRVINK
jgi:hypothetical protein